MGEWIDGQMGGRMDDDWMDGLMFDREKQNRQIWLHVDVLFVFFPEGNDALTQKLDDLTRCV